MKHRLLSRLVLASTTAAALSACVTTNYSEGVEIETPHGLLDRTNSAVTEAEAEANLNLKPYARITSTPGVVQSPYAPHNFVDVSDLSASDTLAMDPTTGQVFKIPRPLP